MNVEYLYVTYELKDDEEYYKVVEKVNEVLRIFLKNKLNRKKYDHLRKKSEAFNLQRN